MLTLTNLPYELLIKIGQMIDARKLLINKQLYEYILPYIRNNYIYSYPIIRASSKFEEPYPRIYTNLNEITNITKQLMKNCEIVYNICYKEKNKSHVVDFFINNTKFKELYFHSYVSDVYIECIPNSVKVLSIYEKHANILDFKHLQNLTHLNIGGRYMGVFDISKNIRLEHITFSSEFDRVVATFPENLKSIKFRGIYDKQTQNFPDNIKSLSFCELTLEKFNNLPKNIESLTIQRISKIEDEQVFPNFINLKYLKIRESIKNLIFLNLPNKLEFFYYPGKLSNEIEFPKELRILCSHIHKNIIKLKKLEKITFITDRLDNEFIKLFNSLEFSKVPAYLKIEMDGLCERVHISDSYKIIIPKGVKCCGIFNNLFIHFDTGNDYPDTMDMTPNIIFSEDVETLECYYCTYTKLYSILPKNITTIRYYLNPEDEGDESIYFNDIPDFVKTIEFDTTMYNENHYNKIKDTVKIIKYNISRKRDCEFFSIELADGRKIIQYSKTTY